MGVLFYKGIQRQQGQVTWWKPLIVLLIGLFSFSINGSLFRVPLSVAVLPLGVWILYVFLKGKKGSWERYRYFAWLGFCSNYIFLAFVLVAIPIRFWIYPSHELLTYISNIENGSILSIHPSAAENQSLHGEISVLKKMKPKKVDSEQWYTETNMVSETNRERFPYQIIGTSPKWGSGNRSIVYLERDGKGLLITTPDQQLYFRSNQSLIKGEK